MTSLEEHKNSIHQFLEDINEKIRAGQLVERQKIVGFTASEAATNLLEYFLHKKERIPSGFRVNHNYFASEKRAERYFDFDFEQKKELINLLVKQEEFRELLCYGKEKKAEKVEEAVHNLTKIKEIISEQLGENI